MRDAELIKYHQSLVAAKRSRGKGGLGADRMVKHKCVSLTDDPPPTNPLYKNFVRGPVIGIDEAYLRKIRDILTQKKELPWKELCHRVYRDESMVFGQSKKQVYRRVLRAVPDEYLSKKSNLVVLR